MAERDIKDITIIGAGPVGLFGAFYAGMRGASCRLIDALPELGGQVTALYPEKYIYDVGGFPKILGKDFVRQLSQQALQFKADTQLAQEVIAMRRETGDDGKTFFALKTPKAEYYSRALVIAGGIGAFSPRKLPLDDYDAWLEKGMYDKVVDPKQFAGRRVLLVGGGDSAFDWAVNLQGLAKSVLMIHRRDGFRAHQATIDQVNRLCADGKMELRTFWEVKAIHGEGRVQAVTIFGNKTKEEERLEIDALIPLLGFVSNLGDIGNWGLDLQKEEIVVNQMMETNLEGIYAAGDMVTYPGKLKLIATGFGEACIAVNNAVHHVNPSKKLFPGHSSNMENLFAPTP
ncbi:MAG: NAD(P)/FAD-dependent oxidoreductase [Gemmatimonadales bacterium]|nr:NAD(P)/FAD-dependent oxidoreductase [Gemmatimonadales bacterium]